MRERADELQNTIELLVAFLASTEILDKHPMGITLAAELVNSTMMGVFAEIGARGGSIGSQNEAVTILSSKAAESVAKQVPPLFDCVAKLVQDAKRWKMTDVFEGRHGLKDLIAHNVTVVLLNNVRATLTLHILVGLGLQSFNCRNGPVCEVRPYMQPLVHKLCAAALDRYMPLGRWRDQGLPDDLSLIVEKAASPNFIEVRGGQILGGGGGEGGS